MEVDILGMNNEEKFKKLVEKIKDLKKGKDFDLSTEEDLSIAIMNLVSLEEHFFFTASKTGKKDYFDLLNETREVRKSLMKKMFNEHEGETWCVAKHLLASTMRMIEVGTKYMTDGKKEEAEKMFKEAYRIYSIFWAIRLKLIDLTGLKKKEGGKIIIEGKDEDKKPWSFEDIVNKLVDCCNE